MREGKFIPILENNFKGETLNFAERYRMVMVGGRIKTAGASLRHIYEAAARLIESPDSAEAAFETSKCITQLKQHPPIELRVGFFPQDKLAMRTAFNGAGIYRPTIKTDQGPAGNVGYFYVAENNTTSQLTGNILKEEGVAIEESHFRRRTGAIQDRKELANYIQAVQVAYQRGNYKDADEYLTKLRTLSATSGIETTRRAIVGRGEFFFFRPVQTEQEIIVGKDLTEAISAKTHEVVNRIENLAALTKYFIQSGLSLAEAMRKAHEEQNSYSGSHDSGLLYFQPDVLIRRDGTFDIERINMPDLGMFLTEVNLPMSNDTLDKLKTINLKIKNEVLDVVADAVGQDVTLVTRNEVLTNDEDTLEQLEIHSIKAGLEERGKKVSVTSLTEVNSLPQDSSVVLLNINANGEAFIHLLERVARGEIRCYPDPFLKLFEKEATTFKRHVISEPNLNKFLEIIAPSALDKPEGVFRKYEAIQNALTHGRINADIVYFNIPGTNNLIPTFRYDVKSFSRVHKTMEEARQQGDKPTLTAIPLPFKPEDAIINGADGPRLALFRFMFVKK